jgi:hypothetical protein
MRGASRFARSFSICGRNRQSLQTCAGFSDRSQWVRSTLGNSGVPEPDFWIEHITQRLRIAACRRFPSHHVYRSGFLYVPLADFAALVGAEPMSRYLALASAFSAPSIEIKTRAA